jgi:hypothetical protein
VPQKNQIAPLIAQGLALHQQGKLRGLVFMTLAAMA